MKLTAHCLVKNEENFIWYAINSVINHVDEVMVWDQGSVDNTVSIIKSIDDKKINFRQIGGDVSFARQKMLEETKGGWVFILDGDEIWWEDAIKNIRFKINNCKEDVIVNPNWMLVGDIYHYQDELAGKYKIGDKEGHYNIRAIRNTPGLHVSGIYPHEAYINSNETKVQDLPKEKILFLNDKYLHSSFLPRSSKDTKKVKYELGNEFPKDFYYPEVFFKDRPSVVPSPWHTMTNEYKSWAFIETPFKKLKRNFV